MKAKILGLLAVALLAGPMAANAIVITISGQGDLDGSWDITLTADDSFDNLRATLTGQVWWQYYSRANAFASALGANLGTPNNIYGPYFAWYEVDDESIDACTLNSTDSKVVCGRVGRNGTFAVASRVGSVPEPGSLALLGLGLAGLGLSRRRKV